MVLIAGVSAPDTQYTRTLLYIGKVVFALIGYQRFDTQMQDKLRNNAHKPHVHKQIQRISALKMEEHHHEIKTMIIRRIKIL